MRAVNNIFIRADGSKKIGMGHLKRAVILANYFKAAWGIDTLLITKEDEFAQIFMANQGLQSIYINPNLSVKEEICQIQALSQQLDKPGLVIMDILENDTSPPYIKALRSFQAPLVAITDDSERRVLDADLIINGNPNQLSYDYKNCQGRYLVGPAYFIMDINYASQKISKPSGEVNKIIICVGGSDHNNILFKIIDAVENIGKFTLRIISSKSTGYALELKNYLSLLSGRSELHFDLPSLSNCWSECDIAITAGGNTLFERIAAGIPGCTICQLGRQNEIANRFEELGVNVNFGLANEISNYDLENYLYTFFLNSQNQLDQYNKSRDIVDGKGIERVAKVIYSLMSKIIL